MQKTIIAINDFQQAYRVVSIDVKISFPEFDWYPLARSYGVYVSRFVRYARVCSDDLDFMSVAYSVGFTGKLGLNMIKTFIANNTFML